MSEYSESESLNRLAKAVEGCQAEFDTSAATEVHTLSAEALKCMGQQTKEILGPIRSAEPAAFLEAPSLPNIAGDN